MDKQDAIGICVWLENFAIDHSHGKDYYEAIGRLTKLQKYINEQTNDDDEKITD